MSDPYRRLVEIAQRELECVRDEDFEGLESLGAERSELVRRLPANAPPSARARLEQAALLQAQVSSLLGQQMTAVREGLGKLEHGREAMHGYAPSTERLHLVDRAC